MRRFYILFKNELTIEGLLDCSEEEFKKRFIETNQKDIYSYYLWPKSELKEEEITQLL